MNKDEYPVLKLKYDGILPYDAKIELDGVPLKCVSGIVFSSHVD